MKAVVFRGDRRAEVVEVPKPEPGPGQVLVKIMASSLCGSDLHSYRAPADTLSDEQKNVIRGHEPCGVVAERGKCARGVKEGDRVMVHHYSGCGECKWCLAGWTQLCLRGGHKVYGANANGGHAEYMLIPDTCCVHMPKDLSFEEGASCSCGTGTAYQALKRLQPSGLDTFAVFGQGPVGINAAMMGKAMGARVIGVDTVPERLELGKRFGADEALNAREVDVVQTIKDLTEGEGAHCAIDCTGNSEARVNAAKCARLWGRVCYVGEGGIATFEMSPQIIHKHLTIYGSWTFSTHLLAETAHFIVSHKLPLRDTITQTFPLSRAVEAYQLFDTNTTGKIALIPG